MDNKTIDINTENFTVVNGDITEEQIATWKGKHGRVVAMFSRRKFSSHTACWNSIAHLSSVSVSGSVPKLARIKAHPFAISPGSSSSTEAISTART